MFICLLCGCTVNCNVLGEDCCEQPAAREPKKKPNEAPEEEIADKQTPLKKKKKKRKLTDSTESPGKS